MARILYVWLTNGGLLVKSSKKLEGGLCERWDFDHIFHLTVATTPGHLLSN